MSIGSGNEESGGLPLVEELRPAPDVEAIFVRLAGQQHCLFLDSALRHHELGRFSFLTADPFEFLRFPVNDSRALRTLDERLQRWPNSTSPGLPPFQGGAAGLFSYDLARTLERVSPPLCDEFLAPALAVGFYDVVLAIDHRDDRAWIISQGFPETNLAARRRRAGDRLRQFRSWLQSPSAVEFRHVSPGERLTEQDLAPQFPARERPGLTSNFPPDGYRRAIQQVIDYIHAGDVFQVNLAQRLLYPAREHTVPFYLRLRRRNPATFAAYFDLGDLQIASASPERFVSARHGRVEARPIKGTRRRTPHPVADLFTGDELRESEKDRAENVMIVDLLRNDLSRVCRPESVRVTQLCGLELYQYVQHLVSVVRGELRPGMRPLDLVRGAFPGGSVVGAPKVRAMEIIAELEPTARGAYCGSLGYLGFDGAMDLSILIRTITAGRGWLQFPVGGGIVAQSDVDAEYEETWHKAAGILKALPWSC